MRITSEETAKSFAPLRRDIESSSVIEIELQQDNKTFTLDAYSLEIDCGKTYIDMPCHATRELINRLMEVRTPQKASDKSNFCRTCGATDINVEILSSLFPFDQMIFANEISETTFLNILMRSKCADICADNVAKFKELKQLPDMVYDLEISDNPPADYQLLAAANIMLSPGYALFMEQGTGKTPASIVAICNEISKFRKRVESGEIPNRMFRCIVVAPNNVRMNWKKEIAKFSTRAGKVTVLRGTPIDRIRQCCDALQYEDGAEFTMIVCGYETLSKSWDNCLANFTWDLALIDEAHYIKSNSTARCKTSHLLRDKSDKRIALTGTPICNSIMDLWSILEFCGAGFSGFTSFQQFRKFYGVYEERGGFHTLTGMQNIPFIQERLARYSFHITKKEAMPDLPGKLYTVHEVEMSEQQLEFYKKISEELILVIENEMNSGKSQAMITNCILTQMLRLTQITSGFVTWGAVYDDDGTMISAKEINYTNENPKIRAIEDYVWNSTHDESEALSKGIIWACFIPDLDYIEQVLIAQGVGYVRFDGSTTFDERIEAERRFNYDDTCKWLIGNPAAGGTGLNLLGYPPGEPDKSEMNCDIVIYYSQGWSQPIRSQSEDRCNRRGTRVPTRYIDLCVPNSIDETIRDRVTQKQETAIEITDIRAILATIANGTELMKSESQCNGSK